MWWRNPDEAYEREWAEKVEQLARHNDRPFDEWFGGKDRVYFPFDPDHILGLSEEDEEIIELLEEEGYEVHDYRGGYCRKNRPDSFRPGNDQRIGKVLNRLRRKAIKEVEERWKQGLLHDMHREMRRTTKYFDRIISQFSYSPYRTATEIAKFLVVISQNPHDIARMSTGRNWESCMTLGSGSFHASVFDEVKSGGLIAYLIRSDDPEIDQPLSRIHIRRFQAISTASEQEGFSIAKTEDSVYGEDVEGFKEAVDEWIEQQQDEIPMGLYALQGGSYSDTYSNQRVLHIGGSWKLPSVEQVDELLRVYRGEGLEDVPYHKWVVTINDWVAWRDQHDDDNVQTEYTFYSEEDADEFVENHSLNQWDDWRHDEDSQLADSGEGPYWTLTNDDGEWIHEPLEIEKILVDERPDLQYKAAAKIIGAPKGMYPLELIKEFKFRYPGLQEVIRLRYPELFSDREIEKFSKYDLVKFVKALPEEKRQPHFANAEIKLQALLDDPAAYLIPCLVCEQPIDPTKDPVVPCSLPVREMVHHAKCGSVCELMQIEDDKRQGSTERRHSDYRWAFDHGPRDILDVYIEFRTYPFQRRAKRIPEPIIQKLVALPEKTYYLGEPLLRIHASIVHAFHMTDSDTPTVQRYYESLLPAWEYEFEPLPEQTVRRRLQLLKSRILEINNLGRAIAKLGENGQRFIPWIQARLDRLQRDFGPHVYHPSTCPTPPETFVPAPGQPSSREQAWKKVQRITERYLYILDSIESGRGRSTKYDWSWD